MNDIIILSVWWIVAIIVLSVQIYKLKKREDGFRVTGDDLFWAILTSVFWFIFLAYYIIGLPLEWIFKKVGGKILNWLNE